MDEDTVPPGPTTPVSSPPGAIDQRDRHDQLGPPWTLTPLSSSPHPSAPTTSPHGLRTINPAPPKSPKQGGTPLLECAPDVRPDMGMSFGSYPHLGAPLW